MESAPATAIREQSQRLRRLLTTLLVILIVLLFLERFGAVEVEFGRHGATGDVLRHTMLAIVKAFPEVLYLAALYWIRKAVSAFAEGELYSATISRMLDQVGIALALGAFFATFVLPSASAALGFDPGYLIAFDVSSLVLGAIGLALKIFAHVLRNAAAQQSELEQIF